MLNITVKQHPEDGYYVINAAFENNTAMNFQIIMHPTSDQLTVPENEVNTEGWNDVEFSNITDQIVESMQGNSAKAERSLIAIIMGDQGQLSRTSKSN